MNDRLRSKKIMVYGEKVFNIGDVVKIKIKGEVSVVKGRIYGIDLLKFTLDVSEKYFSSIKEFYFSDIESIEILEQ